ncbi:hypothetical protein B0H10DRAFT_2024309 [Mycena sp. CBHHK59/15]|nr:hypothetical protein B0H10DRAFT_2024309 [Mycena sp. CBHHK59/15]
MSKYWIASLPLPASSTLLTQVLTPDPRTPSVAVFRNQVLQATPSLQRRARLLAADAHFSYVSPFPIPFPYEIEPPGPDDPEPDDKGGYIERWLRDREAVHEQPPRDPASVLRKYTPKIRDEPRELIGLSETGLRDCVPHLNVGDAFALLGTPAFTDPDEPGPTSEMAPSNIEDAKGARQELIDVLSGHAVLMSADSNADANGAPANAPAFAPWSLRYSGHQFGTWAGQLGDGRATSILVTPHPSDPDLTYELQLKGAGRTPFSRSADGLAVLRSSIREYLCSEAMHAIGIPTTRSLALISLPGLPVARERMETACVLTRLAPSFLRIGSFEALSPPAHQFVFGGGQQPAHLSALRTLSAYVADHVLRLGLPEGAAVGQALLLEAARRNARMAAGWQAYGFMHGVINTDNVSIMGLTIDYGPYAFMDVFDPFHICNHTDEEGRYAYRYQPNMIIYALRALLNALAPLIGAEAELGGRAVSADWPAGADTAQLDAWRARGVVEAKDALEKEAQATMAEEYGRLMRRRLALRRHDPTDETTLVKPLLDLMAAHKLDFPGTFRTLATGFTPSMLSGGPTKTNGSSDPTPGSSEADAPLQRLLARLLANAPDAERLDHAQASADWIAWLDAYARRVANEASEWSSDGTTTDVERTGAARAANPRFVLRQWVLEEVIAAVEKDAMRGRRMLAKVLHMACNPFEPWGAEDAAPDEEAELSVEEREERRYCGLGEKKMLGFQCSCSS